MQRTEQLLSLRPEIVVDDSRKSLSEEDFQNQTLRPILKFQNQLILDYFNVKVKDLSIPEESKRKLLFIENCIRKDAVLRNQLIGIVIGLFSVEEFASYLAFANAINKRMTAMLVKRIQDQF